MTANGLSVGSLPVNGMLWFTFDGVMRYGAAFAFSESMLLASVGAGAAVVSVATGAAVVYIRRTAAGRGPERWRKNQPTVVTAGVRT